MSSFQANHTLVSEKRVREVLLPRILGQLAAAYRYFLSRQGIFFGLAGYLVIALEKTASEDD